MVTSHGDTDLNKLVNSIRSKHFLLFRPLDNIIKKETGKHNLNWPEISDHPYRILITGGSGSEKTNLLSNLINQQSDIDKIYYSLKI